MLLPPRLVDKYTYSDLLLAYFDCRKKKRSTMPSTAFEVRYEFNLMDLLDEINAGTYKVGRSRAFVVTWPKVREVWAAQFRDRIVHHLICRDIAPFFTARLIEDTFACIPGRGTLAAAQRAEQFARRITENWQKKAYILQIDIKNYFCSISRAIMWNILKEHIGDSSLTARLTKMIVFHDPTNNPIVKPGTDFSIVPRHKSLWHCKPGYGLPIGNLTSQVFANVYLDAFDHYVKHVLKCRYYVRYVDDAILMAKDKNLLLDWRYTLDEWLQRHRELMLHPDKVRLAPVCDGFTFVGRTIRPFRSIARKMTLASTVEAARQLQKFPQDQDAIVTLNSYLGMLQHGSMYAFRRKICSMVRLPGVVGCDPEYTKVFSLL